MAVETIDDVGAHPGLNQIAFRLPEIRISPEPFDPAGDWSQDYSILAAESGAVCGFVSLTRRGGGTSGNSLSVLWRTGAGAQSHWRLEAKIESQNDSHASTRSWRLSGAQHQGRFDAPKEGISGTEIVRSGEVQSERIVLRTDSSRHERTYAASGPVTVNWQLFELVQRLNRGELELGTFTVIDHFELTRISQQLSYRGAFLVNVGGEPRTLHGFDLIGAGTPPCVYWVDEQSSRLVAVVSGLEAYVLGKLPAGGGRVRDKGPRKGE